VRDSEPVNINLFAAWHHRADQNVDEWGLQDVETILLAMQEEMGELTQAHLEATHEDGDADRVEEEMADLGALLLQLHMRLKRNEKRSVSTGDAQDSGGDCDV